MSAETHSAPRTARELARAELTRAIKQSASEQLAEVGPSALSLRAVARALGMASSAVYRYFASRDELLTALIIDAYNSVGEAAEQADAQAKAEGHPPTGRWLAVNRAVRAWALANKHQFELVYGTPVPGYAAPQDTTVAAARMPLTLVGIYNEAHPEFPADRPQPEPGLITETIAELITVPEGRGRLILAWSGLIGVLSFELFGQFNGVVTDYAKYFDYTARATAAELGLG
ncbi:TetR family transcriptional regulator [Actinorhabdospora filicis]|uniref:TetR family transcriptional regulator n=1 Tax=Actinorhabdospora filicis TaxID=1785913 RepID=A0A9W6W4K0_9ACTN|nr:TetR/AcrR family transcriptional regulator [Actinorhabdospora filicis]GLZ79342.1 TetR family transcriptional regulator [Actinorhabdospora filicis]